MRGCTDPLHTAEGTLNILDSSFFNVHPSFKCMVDEIIGWCIKMKDKNIH